MALVILALAGCGSSKTGAERDAEALTKLHQSQVKAEQATIRARRARLEYERAVAHRKAVERATAP